MVPKFRAWDKEGKLYQDEEVSIVRGQFVKSSYAAAWWMKEAELFNVQQSTGLKDKNGVEIFEGDLVKVSVDNGFDYLFEELSIVEPSKIHSGLVCSLKSHEAEYRIIHAEILGYEYEVVGNIYENPELLEEKS